MVVEEKGVRAREGENTNHEWTRMDTNFELKETEGTRRERRPLTLTLS
jgi:hypothetical protein